MQPLHVAVPGAVQELAHLSTLVADPTYALEQILIAANHVLSVNGPESSHSNTLSDAAYPVEVAGWCTTSLRVGGACSRSSKTSRTLSAVSLIAAHVICSCQALNRRA